MQFYEKKKYFCILPWLHLNLGPTGEVHSCCRSDFKKPLGFFSTSSLEEIWNNNFFRQLRLDIKNNKKISSCVSCHQQEENGEESLRQESNNEWKEYYNKVDEMNSDGSVHSFEPLFLDLRFSNICNFKCRICGPDYSTAWYADSGLLETGYIKPDFLNQDKLVEFWEELIKILPKIRKIYFAGGEPLLHKDHYRLLDELLKLNKSEVQLIYNTNLSSLELEGRSVIDIWKRFRNVTVSASLDGIEKKGEYIRKGMSWNIFYENRKRISKEAPHIYFNICWTLSVFNCFHLIEAMKFIIEKNFLNSGSELRINILHAPSYYSVGILNPSEREKLKKEYNVFTKKYLKIANFPRKELLESKLNYILAHLEEVDLVKERIVFDRITSQLDEIRCEKFENLFPELS